MARQTAKIRTEAFIHIGNQLVSMDLLNEQQRLYVATRLRHMYLNELYIGKAEFGCPDLPPAEEVFAAFKK